MNLIAIGDSVTAPTRTNAWVAGQGWAALVATRFGLTEVNLGISGSTTTQQGAQWAAAMVMDPENSIIIAMPGENDIPTTPISTFKAQLDAQVGSAVIAGFPVILHTVCLYPNTDYYNAAPGYLQATRDIAAKYRIPCVDVFAAFSEFALTRTDFSTLIHPDGHPTIIGMREIANLYERHPYKRLLTGVVTAPIVYPPTIPISVNAIPVMTGPITNGVCMDGNDYVAGLTWRLSNGSPSDCTQWNHGGAGWATVEFPMPFVASAYSMQSRVETGGQVYAPKSWTFEGLNSAGGWDILDSRQNMAGWGIGETRKYALSSLTSHTKFRINVTASQSGSYLQWRNLQIYN